MTKREEIVELVNKLFIYTDEREWNKLQDEVFAKEVHLDMSSLGAEAIDTTGLEICNMWAAGFEGIDAVNHLAGNYLIDFRNDEVVVFAYATATHFKQSATKGKTREFVGTYDLKLNETNKGWRIFYFRYNLKYSTGNLELS